MPGDRQLRPRTRHLLLAGLLSLSACAPAPPKPAPGPAPVPPPRPAPAPTPVPGPTYSNWEDAPQSPGDWYYRATADGGVASFGSTDTEALLALTCHRGAQAIEIDEEGQASGPVTMTIRTEAQDRSLSAQPRGPGLSIVATTLSASDPLLDAMAYSKGRFAVQTTGLPTLYLPAWPEVARVIEDCR